MTIEISQTMLYVSGAFLVLILIVIISLIARNAQRNNDDKSKGREAKRRKAAASRIEAKIKADLADQSKILNNYISDLKYHIGETNKKVFFNVTNNTQTEPSYLFNVLRSAFKISKYGTVYYCRRNSSTFGSDDYFIITEDGFHFGDSCRENGEGLMFRWVSKVEDSGCGMMFLNESDELLDSLGWEYILYNGSIQEKVDFIEDTNRFLNKYKTTEEILINAALEAADEKAIPVLSRLTERLGIDDPLKQFVRAAYYFVLAEDGINTKHHLELCNYAITDIENAAKNASKDDGEDFKSYYLFGMCEILRIKIALLSNDDSYDIEQNLKELMGPSYHQDVREEASRLLSIIRN